MKKAENKVRGLKSLSQRTLISNSHHKLSHNTNKARHKSIRPTPVPRQKAFSLKNQYAKQ